MGVFDLVTCRTWHFAGLKFISQDLSHCSSLERSSCRIFASDNELIARYMAVSSAKSLTLVPGGHLYMPEKGWDREQSPAGHKKTLGYCQN